MTGKEFNGSHGMETSVKKAKKRRNRRKRKSKARQSKRNSASPSRNLGVAKHTIERKNVREVKLTEEQIDSFIKACYDHPISVPQSQQEDHLKHVQNTGDVFEQTVDLCDDDPSLQNFNSSLVIVPHLEGEQKDSTVVDLSEDHSEQNEVIDLTEPSILSQNQCDAAGRLEPAVIDISEDETKEKSDLKPENDDIFVIGTFTRTSHLVDRCGASSSYAPLSNQWNGLNSIIYCCDKIKKNKYRKRKLFLDKMGMKDAICCKKKFLKTDKAGLCLSEVTKIGKNIYVNSPVVLPSCGLRPIIIDGSNVAFVHSNSNFSCKRLEICINYFKEKGHKVTAFVPQFRINSSKSDDPELLKKLERRGDVILTPSKQIDGMNIVPYDDRYAGISSDFTLSDKRRSPLSKLALGNLQLVRNLPKEQRTFCQKEEMELFQSRPCVPARFIVQTAALKGGIIVTRDNYNDLLKENPAWAETIKYRTLAFTWVDDVLMFPKDPLGEFGPSLEEFLRFG